MRRAALTWLHCQKKCRNCTYFSVVIPNTFPVECKHRLFSFTWYLNDNMLMKYDQSGLILSHEATSFPLNETSPKMVRWALSSNSGSVVEVEWFAITNLGDVMFKYLCVCVCVYDTKDAIATNYVITQRLSVSFHSAKPEWMDEAERWLISVEISRSLHFGAVDLT